MSVHTSLGLAGSRAARAAFLGSTRHWFRKRLYHTALGLSFGKRISKVANQRIQRLWSNKTIMIIDEISMMDLQTLANINRQCSIARSQESESSELFAGLPVVMFMGDFYQFPPVKGVPLWGKARDNNEDEQTGRDIWHQFTQVVILDEQMRQSEDDQCRDLLRRASWATNDRRFDVAKFKSDTQCSGV